MKEDQPGSADGQVKRDADRVDASTPAAQPAETGARPDVGASEFVERARRADSDERHRKLRRRFGR